MKPRGDTRKLLLYLGEIQDAIGKAQGAAKNDRDAQQADHLQEHLTQAFDLCLAARSRYPYVDGTLTDADKANRGLDA